ncbi:polypeptide N-acetylgalactosaminyltransferase [Mytilus galloprovincialis]|uniref:Polypeptide N-acetylgalactosaminyltransferase n=1 Tax=Mytilus galloprovincialis TaxID=29158 RepID=A0A8B6DXZ1_MYTGA|nr:polypeptide N-acetylgalactosaminyltransferase [Mytilus galloprovincialis]
MRRNTVTLLKFLVAAVLCIMAFKYFTGGHGGTQDVYVDSKFPHEGGGGAGNKRAMIISDGDMKKIDWHNYKQIAEEKQRTGPGEQGQSVILDAADEKKKADLYKVNGFNAFASDKISLHRSMKDIRHPDCKNKKYWNKLPTASVIVPFHNEHWTTLLRTAWSAVERSPPGLLKEVILVDDFSSKEFLKQKLDDYVSAEFKDFSTIVKVVRAKKREGLIRTRLLGAKAATGDVLIFLDSHCETNVNWLPPLLDPIQEDYKTVVCPFIDVVDYETFAYRAQDEGARGAFDWEFFYKRLPLRPEDLRQPAEPFNSPVMAGGLFAISSKWFWEMGGYDPGLDIWGGEQYELSFKIWQCGGKMIDAPCSRIGHIYRKFAPFANPGVGDFVGRNYKRVAEVWMDEYATYLYNHRPHYKSIDPGDLTEQKAIRQKLKCKPFKWFMKEVAFDLEDYYPAVEPPPFANGEIRNVGANMCIDTRFKGQNERFSIEPCIKDGGNAGGEQNIELTWHKDIRPGRRSVCFDVSQSIKKAPVLLYNCHGMKGNQRFKYNIVSNNKYISQSIRNATVLLYNCHGMKGNQRFKYNIDTKQIFHPISNQCLDCDPSNKELFMNPCDQSSDTQKWKVEHIEEDKVKHEWGAP